MNGLNIDRESGRVGMGGTEGGREGRHVSTRHTYSLQYSILEQNV